MRDQTIKTYEDLLRMLDARFRPAEKFWDPFYSNREKPVPFFRNAPDENLVSYCQRNLVTSGKAMDIGCGAGRNSIYLARQGFEVDAYDISQVAIDWAQKEQQKKA